MALSELNGKQKSACKDGKDLETPVAFSSLHITKTRGCHEPVRRAEGGCKLQAESSKGAYLGPLGQRRG